MGYGSRALNLLQMYYEGKFPCLEEKTVQKPKEIATVSSEVMELSTFIIFPIVLSYLLLTVSLNVDFSK